MSGFKHGDAATVSLANKLNYKISFFQVPSNAEVSFKSMLTNFSDNFASTWDRKDVYGRMDPIQVFQGTRRSINLAWDIVSGDSYEGRENMRKISILMNMLYPSYEGDGGKAGLINTAPVFKIKFLNLITDSGNKKGKAGASAKTAGLVGTVDGFTFSPDLQYGFHGTPDAMNETVEGISRTAKKDQLSIYPKVINMSCTFHVTHTHQLGWTTSGKPRSAGFPYDVRMNENIPKSSFEAGMRGVYKARDEADAVHKDAQLKLDKAFEELAEQVESGALSEGAAYRLELERALEEAGQPDSRYSDPSFKSFLEDETKGQSDWQEYMTKVNTRGRKRGNAVLKAYDEAASKKMDAKLKKWLDRRK